MKLMSGNSNLPLVKAIANYLEIPVTEASVRRFADEEVFVEIHENVRGEDVFVVQSTSYPANDNLMELLICIDALKRASAKRITAVVPYFGYARQDRKPGPRTPISAKLVANLITVAGASRVLSVDLHAGQIQGFFDIPTDNSAGTLANAAAALREAGAEDVVAYCTHGVLSGAAVPRVDKSALSELVVTDSIAAPEAVSESGKIRVLTIAPLLGEALKRIADESSGSSLFD